MIKIKEGDGSWETFEKIYYSSPKNEEVIVDLSERETMTTVWAKEVFGLLYYCLGKETYNQNIKIIGAKEEIKQIIEIGIEKFLK